MDWRIEASAGGLQVYLAFGVGGSGGSGPQPVVLINETECRSYRLYAESCVISVSAGLTATLR